MGVRYQKYRSIAIPLNIGIELSQVSRYFDIFGIEPALHGYQNYIIPCACVLIIMNHNKLSMQKCNSLSESKGIQETNESAQSYYVKPRNQACHNQHHSSEKLKSGKRCQFPEHQTFY